MTADQIDLSRYQQGDYSPGASRLKQILWYFVGTPILRSFFIPSSRFKVYLLRLFGAEIGNHVRIKTGVRVKFPWRLKVGDHVWIGEDVWIDNLAEVKIGCHVCISQDVYLCTGNHDWSHPNFVLRTTPIQIENGVWLGARSIVGPGVTVGPGAVLSLGCVTTKSLAAMTIYASGPLKPIKKRRIRNI
jgi:putative colanic acid biosynthesis acetyltransferase WcaF